MHPGAVCRFCPSTLAAEARLDEMAAKAGRPYWVPMWWPVKRTRQEGS